MNAGLLGRVGAQRYRLIYLALSTLSGFFEIGVITLPMRQGAPFIQALLLGVAYQLGATLRATVTFKAYQSLGLAVTGIICAGLSSHSSWLLIPSVLALSVVLHDVHARSKQQPVGTFAKRMARIVGFAASGFFSLAGAVGTGVGVILAIALLWDSKSAATEKSGLHLEQTRSGWSGALMLLHQSQYFCYAYAVPYVLISLLGLRGLPFAGAYIIGWGSYTLAFLVFPKHTPLRSLIIGHTLVALSLLCMFAFVHTFPIFLAASSLAGLGGGTVFCLQPLKLRWQETNVDLPRWESLGHMGGVLIAALLAMLSPMPTPLTFLAGAIVALAVVITGGIAQQRVKQPDDGREGQRSGGDGTTESNTHALLNSPEHA